MKLVIDASVAVKWVIDEDRHELARDVLRDGFVLTAPDLLLIEVANALRNKVRVHLIDDEHARSGLNILPQYFDQIFRARDVLVNAFDVACRINHPVADCVYLACALESDATLVTDDTTLSKKADSLGAKVLLLGDWTPQTPAASK